MNRVVLVLAGFILTCSNCLSARFTVLIQESPVVVAVGDVAVIACRISIIHELVEVRWIRSYAGRRYIISLFHEGRDQQRCDLPEYVGRTELVKEGFARGSASLKLFNVSVADEGAYRCFLETGYYFDMGDLELRVTALGSPPRIDIEGFQDGGIKVVCRSAGWYPEPTLVNKDHDGEMKVQQEENGLYNIEYSRIITKNSNRTFSCRLWTSFHRPDRETSVYVADDLFRKCADTTAWKSTVTTAWKSTATTAWKSTDTAAWKSTVITTVSVIPAFAFVLVAAAIPVAVAAFHVWTYYRNKQGASSAVYTEPRYLKVPLDQGLSYVKEQSQVCAAKNTTEGGSPAPQSKDTIEQSQMCAVKNTEASPPVQQSQDTTEQSEVLAVRNITEGGGVLCYRHRIQMNSLKCVRRGESCATVKRYN